MAKSGKYAVYVDDNFHFMDEGERYAQGRYRTLAQAVKVCRGIVDEWLKDNLQPGMTAEDLLAKYKSFGEDPWVSGDEEKQGFSAWDYAEERCREIRVLFLVKDGAQ